MCATDLGSCVRRMSGWPGLALRGTSGGGASCTCHVDPQLALIQPSPRACAGGGGGGRLARDAASLGLGGSDDGVVVGRVAAIDRIGGQGNEFDCIHSISVHISENGSKYLGPQDLHHFRGRHLAKLALHCICAQTSQ